MAIRDDVNESSSGPSRCLRDLANDTSATGVDELNFVAQIKGIVVITRVRHKHFAIARPMLQNAHQRILEQFIVANVGDNDRQSRNIWEFGH